MSIDDKACEQVPSTSFLEYAFLRWILSPAATPELYRYVTSQKAVKVNGRRYFIDYEIQGSKRVLAIELDGYGPHSSRQAFSYDRMRQNDLHATGRIVARFSYDSIRNDTIRCVEQLQTLLREDLLLADFVVANPMIEQPEMNPDPLHALDPSPAGGLEGENTMMKTYFDSVRDRLNNRTLRECQTQALEALTNYYGSGGDTAACVISVGSGKTALGVAASLAFSRRRALVVTPGSVIRGVFDKAFDHTAPGNVLYGLPGGPLIPGSRPPKVLTLDREDGAIRSVSREQLLEADVIVTHLTQKPRRQQARPRME